MATVPQEILGSCSIERLLEGTWVGTQVQSLAENFEYATVRGNFTATGTSMDLRLEVGCSSPSITDKYQVAIDVVSIKEYSPTCKLGDQAPSDICGVRGDLSFDAGIPGNL